MPAFLAGISLSEKGETMECGKPAEIEMYVLGLKRTALCDQHVVQYIKAKATLYAPEVFTTPETCEHQDDDFYRVVNRYVPFHIAAHT